MVQYHKRVMFLTVLYHASHREKVAVWVLDSWPGAADTRQRMYWIACCSSSQSLHGRLLALMVSKGTCWLLLVVRLFYIRPGYADYKSVITAPLTCGHSIARP